jgi:hypothetical protein
MEKCLRSKDSRAIYLQSLAIEDAMAAYEDAYRNADTQRVYILSGNYGSGKKN